LGLIVVGESTGAVLLTATGPLGPLGPADWFATCVPARAIMPTSTGIIPAVSTLLFNSLLSLLGDEIGYDEDHAPMVDHEL
jgi:hypothetical protein